MPSYGARELLGEIAYASRGRDGVRLLIEDGRWRTPCCCSQSETSRRTRSSTLRRFPVCRRPGTEGGSTPGRSSSLASDSASLRAEGRPRGGRPSLGQPAWPCPRTYPRLLPDGP